MIRLTAFAGCLLATAPAWGGDPDVPQATVDAGGRAAASADYAQWAGGIGEICATALTSDDASGRSGYVGQLPEPAVVQFVEERTVTRRSAGTVRILLRRAGDEDGSVAVPVALTGVTRPADQDLSPTTAVVVLPGIGDYPLDLAIVPREDGMDANLMANIAATASDTLLLGSRTRTLVTLLADPRDDGRTRPHISSDPPLAGEDGVRWSYSVEVDTSGLALPHVLQESFFLEFELVDPPADARVVKTGRNTALVTWDPPRGADDHHVIRIQVRDRETGLGDIQDARIYIIARPAGGG